MTHLVISMQECRFQSLKMDELELAIDNCRVSFNIDKKYEKNRTEGHIFRKS